MSTTSHPLHRELPHADGELMTIKEVATLVRVPEATLRYWRNDVIHWLEEQSRHPQAGD